MGKSTLLAALNGQADPRPVKTVGFSQKHIRYGVDGGEYRVHFFDVSGAWPNKWAEYVAECHGVAYVFDSAASDEDFGEAVKTFHDTSVLPQALKARSCPALPSECTVFSWTRFHCVPSPHSADPSTCFGKRRQESERENLELRRRAEGGGGRERIEILKNRK